MSTSQNAKPEQDTQQSEELTPEARQIIFKARRSFGFSMTILLLGFIAIVGALVYRSMRLADTAASRYSLPEISLPAGAELKSAVPSEGLLALTYTVAGKSWVRLVNGKTGALVSEIPVKN